MSFADTSSFVTVATPTAASLSLPFREWEPENKASCYPDGYTKSDKHKTRECTALQLYTNLTQNLIGMFTYLIQVKAVLFTVIAAIYYIYNFGSTFS